MRESWPKIPAHQQRLRKLRQTVPMSLSELAGAAECSYGHLRRIETTAYRPSAELATRIARALTQRLGHTVTPDDILPADTGQDAA